MPVMAVAKRQPMATMASKRGYDPSFAPALAPVESDVGQQL